MCEDWIQLIIMSIRGCFCEECTKKINTLCSDEGVGMEFTLCDSCANIYRDMVIMREQLRNDTVEKFKLRS